MLEWVAISFSNAWKWKVKVKPLSRVWLLVTPWTAAYQAPPSMGFPRRHCLLHHVLTGKYKFIMKLIKLTHKDPTSTGVSWVHGRVIALCSCSWVDVFNNLKVSKISKLHLAIANYWPRGMVWGGRREEGSGWGTHVYLWRIHFDIWQN